MKILRLLCLCGLLADVRAELFLPRIFGDHMVLQAGQPVPVWGTAEPGETVTVRFAGQDKRAIAAANGRWFVRLDALPVSAQGAEFSVVARESRTFTDVLVGEVWLCSGQSNMEEPLGPFFQIDDVGLALIPQHAPQSVRDQRVNHRMVKIGSTWQARTAVFLRPLRQSKTTP